jgi:hypothetical protein
MTFIQASLGASTSRINMNSLELSDNYRNKVTGVCGDWDGNDDPTSEPPVVPPEENLFYSCGANTWTHADQVDQSLCNTVYMREYCEGVETEDYLEGMIYKRQDESEDSGPNLEKREILPKETAQERCQKIVTDSNALIVISNVLEQFPLLADVLSKMEDDIETSINNCVSDATTDDATAAEEDLVAFIASLSDDLQAHIARNLGILVGPAGTISQTELLDLLVNLDDGTYRFSAIV